MNGQHFEDGGEHPRVRFVARECGLMMREGSPVSLEPLPPEEFTPHAQADRVVMPNHYARHPVEPIRFAVENYGPGFLIGNIVKYVTRYDAKDGHKDLAKAARYVEMLRRYEMGDPDWYKAEHGDEVLPSDPATPLRTLGNKAPSRG